MNRAVVVDVGSNSIKCLVAQRDAAGLLQAVWEKTLPVRISAGISHEHPMLRPAAIEAGLEAIEKLLQSCRVYTATDRARLVATSAVRDAENGPDFARRVHERVGLPLQILSGADEAHLIARGIAEDPALKSREDAFCAADLGGGSLELIRVIAHRPDPAISLPLGTVRLIEQLSIDARAPLAPTAIRALREQVRQTVSASGFPLRAPLVGTGGVVTVWRAMTAAATNQSLAQSPSTLARPQLAPWIGRFGRLSWEQRLAIPGLPPARADIVPAGFVILDTLLEMAEADSLTHSFCNLRYGLAAEILG